MLAGILFQLGTTTIFVVLAVDFIVRVVWNKPYSARWLEARNLCRRRSKNTEKSERGTGDSSASSVVTDTTHPSQKLEDTHGPWLRKNQYLLLGIAWATLMIYIRGIYRSIELAEGWSGKIITTEVSWMITGWQLTRSRTLSGSTGSSWCSAWLASRLRTPAGCFRATRGGSDVLAARSPPT